MSWTPISVKFRCGSRPRKVSSESLTGLLLCILIHRVPPPSLNFSQARCISLVCYPIHDTGPQAIQQVERCNQGFEILRPVPWKEVPPVCSFSMNDELTFDFPHEVRFRHIL